jgi:nucleoside-triphosphatase
VPLLLLTGVPGIGKTTVLRRAAERLAAERTRGFFTDELRQGGVRVGFGIETLDGRHATLARVGVAGPARVGRYGVALRALDRIVAAVLTGSLLAGRWAAYRRESLRRGRRAGCPGSRHRSC